MRHTTSSKHSRLLQDIADLEGTLSIVDARAQLGKLMRFDANLAAPVHRWFKFKESFSGDLVKYLLTAFPPRQKREIRFLDPFCGVGTSLLAAEEHFAETNCKAPKLRGVEVNPYMAFVARTKLDWSEFDPVSLMRAAAVSLNGVTLDKPPTIPILSTFQDPRFIRRKDLTRLLDLRDKIRAVARPRLEQRPLLLGLAAAAERLFNLRKDGRALRFTPRSDKVSVDEAVHAAWGAMAEDLQLGINRPPSDHHIVLGDGRRADKIFGRERFDVILFSPPYLNNIDYTEVYKLELWLLGFIKSPKAMVSQRRKTFRSHPSCTFPGYSDALYGEAASALGLPFRRLVEYASEQHRWRRRLINGYFADILRTLRSCRRLLAKDGRVFLVTGNSLHGSADNPIPIATDVWTAALAPAAGLKLDSLLIGRDLPRRKIAGGVLRESVLVFSAKESE